MPLTGSLFDAPLLKAGVLYDRVEGGTYVELGERSFFMRGEKLYPILSRMLDSLDGARSTDEMRAALPEKLVPLFDQLLDQLLQHRMLTSGPADAIPDDHPHAPTLRFFRDVTSRWRECFEEWTRIRITLTGSPELTRRLARAMASAGAASLAIVDLDLDLDLNPDVDADARATAGEPPRAASRQPSESRSMLLYIGAQPPDADTLSRLSVEVTRHDVAILAAVCGEVGIVGPDCRDSLTTWRDLLSRAAGSGQAFTNAAINVLASLLAFEAMQERLAAWSDDAEEYGRRAKQFRVVRCDGSVSSYDSEVFLASGRSLDGSAKGEPLVTPADPVLARFFDPSSGLFREAAVPGPEYPLAHRAVTLTYASADGEARETLLYEWGPDAAAADQRLMAHAFATLVTARVGHEAAPGISPMCAAASQEEARARAVSYALATRPAFVRDHPRRAAEITHADGAGVQMLARLAYLYTGALPAVWTAGAAEQGACIAWARVGEWTAAAIGPDAGRALFEALGEALSACQLGRLTDRQMAWPLSALRLMPPLAPSSGAAGAVEQPSSEPAAADRLAVSGATAIAAAAAAAAAATAASATATAPFPIEVEYVAADEPYLPASLHVGHARVHGA